MTVGLFLLALLSGPLEQLAQTLQKAPGWQAEFSQVFVPAGLTQGAEERGLVTFVYPSRLRFDYRTGPQRVFAVDGLLARMVDAEAGTCRAVILSQGAWASLPLAALTDPGSLRAQFQVEERERTVVLLPRHPSPELARVDVLLGKDGLPQVVVVQDTGGNRNQFHFFRWKKLRNLEKGFFSPSLPGQPPCLPDDDNPANQR